MPLARTLVVLLTLAAGCGGEAPPLACGPGTVRVGDQCLPSGSPYDAGVPTPDVDGGTTLETDGGTTPGTDAGGWWTGTEPNPGCVEATGECDAWEAEILAALQGGCAGLTLDPTLQTIADDHSTYQADIDRLSATGPRGTIFDQLREHEVGYRDAGALFSVTRDGAADVLGRWADGEGATILGRCYTHVGISFQTSATEASYATVVLVVR